MDGSTTIAGEGTVVSRTSSYRSTNSASGDSALIRAVGKTVADVDGSSLHKFRALRHFNVSIPIARLEEAVTSQFKEQFNATKAGRGKKVIPRQKMQTSTHRLDQLTKSSFSEFGEVKSFKKLLIDERAKQRKEELAITQKLIGGTMTASPPRHTASRERSRSPGSSVDYLASAKEKLGVYSQSFEPKMPDNQIWIGGFHGARLTLEEFKLQIRRCLGASLSSNEIEALFESFEIDSYETIDGVHFTRLFYALGHQCRHAVQTTSLNNLLQHEKDSKHKQDFLDEQTRQWELQHVSSETYSPEDAAYSFGKLRELALHKPGPVATAAFESFMTPGQFKQQLFKSFGLELTREQTAVLIERYKSSDLLQKKIEHCIDGKKLLQDLKGRLLLEAKEQRQKIEKERAAARERTQAASRTEYTLNLPLGR